MACVIVPGGELIAAVVLQKVIGKERAERLKLKWLNMMLGGGVVVLAVEHIWHGEIVPWPPFFTAMGTWPNIAPMLQEMATEGLAMSAVLTLTWAVFVVVHAVWSKRERAKKGIEA